MEDTEFDGALVASAFSLAGERGWPAVSVTVAARAADLPLDRARGRFMGRNAILGRFGRLADQHALAQAASEGTNRDRLFDLVMRRVDFLQTHREGVLALKTYLPRDPGLTLMLGAATLGSMAWMLEAAGVPARGLRGSLRAQGMLAVWLSTLRAWERDASEDLSATMAALDKALDRAVQAESWFRFGRTAEPETAGGDMTPEAAAETEANMAEMRAELPLPPASPLPDAEPPLPSAPMPPAPPASPLA